MAGTPVGPPRSGTGRPAGPAPTAPWRGIAVTAACLAAMAAASLLLWDRIPELVTTREATPARPGTEVPRAVAVSAVPAVLLLVAAVLAASALGGRAVRRRLGAAPAPARSAAGALDAPLMLLSPFLAVLHLVLLLLSAGIGVPAGRIMAVAVGLLLTGLGSALPGAVRAGAPGPPERPAAAAWVRAQRPGGAALAVVGAVSAAAALVLPPLPVAVAAALAAPSVYLVVSVSRVLGRGWSGRWGGAA
ncbi:hypothetical protein [Nocardiopsis potens]|uniref:hypothetical protein n=1 Tax=Nocardiopsis potens TaxID=1246458 RepID=UPI00034A4565|nr:hypothetical protein [Nocardiopsis potens]